MWFSDLEKALAVFKIKCPEVETFETIEGNMYGDFVIRTSTSTFLITHDNFNIYQHDKLWDVNKWVRV